MKGLYIHIPFCEYICHYCDFVKRIPKDQEMIDTYIDHLIAEIESYHAHVDTIETIYIGGGTPSMLSILQFTRLFEVLKDIKPVEFSIEMNPDSYTHEKGLLFKSYGVNRISIGVQTFNETLLKSLNRKHTKEQIFYIINDLKSIGITNLSVDLIFAIPGQTMDMLAEDLAYVQTLDIDHISSYSLILEERTFFYQQFLKGKFHTVDEDTEAEMYEFVIKTLESYGYEHYEISNFAKRKRYSQHNLIYWSLGDYIGVGQGAHGLVDGYRTYNEHLLTKYLEHPLKEKVYQERSMLLQDEFIFGLRKLKGVDLKMIEDKYHIDVLKTYPKLKNLANDGLIEIKDNMLKLTKKGIMLGNQVFMIFI